MQHQSSSLSQRESATGPQIEQTPSIYHCIQAFSRVVAATTNDLMMAQQFGSLTIQSSNSPATSRSFPLDHITIDQADTFQARSDNGSPTQYLSDPWSLQDPVVQSKIHHLYKWLVAHFSTSNQAYHLVNIVAGVERNNFRVLRSVMLGWFDAIIGEIGRIFWIGVSREEVYRVLVSTEELGGGSYRVFMEVGVEVEGLEGGLGRMEL
jgi:hypothetical protein